MNMVEKVASAIELIDFNMPGAGGLRGKLHIAGAQSKEIARAAIEAMREPTNLMTLEGAIQNKKFMELNSTNADRIYKSMIDAALKE